VKEYRLMGGLLNASAGARCTNRPILLVSTAVFCFLDGIFTFGRSIDMKRIPLVLIAILWIVSAYSQDAGYLPGAIITPDNIRIEGLVKNINLIPARVLDNIKFKREEGAKVEVFSPDELLGYESDGLFFVPKTLSTGTKSFVRKFNAGKLRLYGVLVLSGASYAPAYIPYIQMENEQVIREVTDIGFRKQMLAVLKDAPELCKLIESRTLRRKDLEEIVRRYNEEVGEQTK
jgi:hypothetical protein